MSDDNRDVAMIPYFAHEGEMNRAERMNKRLWIVIIILIVSLIGTNAAWIVYENQFTDILIEQDASADDGGSNYLNGTGELNFYGQGTSDD